MPSSKRSRMRVAGVRPYPVTPEEIVDTIGAFEAATRSLTERRPLRVAELQRSAA